MSAQEWSNGKNTPPPRASLKPGGAGAPAAANKMSFKAKKSPAELQQELDAANAKIKELEELVAKLRK
jgi:hypothetical protein